MEVNLLLAKYWVWHPNNKPIINDAQYPLIGYCPMPTYVIMYYSYNYLYNRLPHYVTPLFKLYLPQRKYKTQKISFHRKLQRHNLEPAQLHVQLSSMDPGRSRTDIPDKKHPRSAISLAANIHFLGASSERTAYALI